VVLDVVECPIIIIIQKDLVMISIPNEIILVPLLQIIISDLAIVFMIIEISIIIIVIIIIKISNGLRIPLIDMETLYQIEMTDNMVDHSKIEVDSIKETQ